MAKRIHSSVAESSGGTAAAVAAVLTEDVQLQIRERAYQLFEARGRELGHDVEDWLQAEAEILATLPQLAA